VLLGRLSVFAGGFGLDAAEAVCGSGAIDVLDVAGLLGSLVDKTLVVAEPAGGTLQYRLLETIRLFAAEQLADAGEQEAAAAAAAHCAHFLAVAEQAEGDLEGARSAVEATLRRSRRQGDNRSLAGAFLRLACLAGDTGDWHRAAVLHGIAQGFGDRTGIPWIDVDVHLRRDSPDQARAHLGEEQLERAYSQGSALSPDKAFDLALRRPDPA
jgi:hypothetical protein